VAATEPQKLNVHRPDISSKTVENFWISFSSFEMVSLEDMIDEYLMLTTSDLREPLSPFKFGLTPSDASFELTG
jgi:hypothetical protein